VVLFGRQEKLGQSNIATAEEAIEVLYIKEHQTKKIPLRTWRVVSNPDIRESGSAINPPWQS